MNSNNENNMINISLIVEKALEYYDMKNIKNYKYLQTSMTLIDREQNTIKFTEVDDVEYKYEVLGVFDNSTNIWMWSWMVPEFMYNETNITRQLLNYGLKITPTFISPIPDDKLYLKTQMVNSRFLLHNEFQLELHLAISSYLAKDNFNFIYYKRKYLNKEKTKYITVYYLII